MILSVTLVLLTPSNPIEDTLQGNNCHLDSLAQLTILFCSINKFIYRKHQGRCCLWSQAKGFYLLLSKKTKILKSSKIVIRLMLLYI